jgi:hypothetical protein
LPSGTLRPRVGEIVGGAPPFHGERDERDERCPRGKKVNVERRHAETKRRPVEDDEERWCKQKHAEQKQRGKKLVRAAGSPIEADPPALAIL